MNARYLAATAALFAIPATAWADTAPAAADSPWTLEGSVTVSSDYRYRGLSLSDHEPALSGEISLSHSSGFYGTVWASSLAIDGKADDVEADFILGWNHDLGGATLDVSEIYYSYPHHSGLNYHEAAVSLGTSVEGVDLEAGVAYAYKQKNLGNADNTYVYASFDMPMGETPYSLHGTFGIEDGAFGDAKKDWQLGITRDLGHGFEASVDYFDTAHAGTRLGKPTAVASLSWGF